MHFKETCIIFVKLFKIKKMEDISKITVKHFLNTTLASKVGGLIEIDSKGKEIKKDLYQLYVKITFMRKTTQIKSIVNNSFFTIEDAYNDYSELIKAETKMIEDLIENEYIRLKNNFTLKGIGDKCKKYSGDFKENIFDLYIWKDFNKAILKSRSKFMRLLLYRFKNIPAMTYYDAAIKLIGEIAELTKLKPKFINFEKIEEIMRTDEKLQELKVIEWKYGSAKEYMSHIALGNGISFKEVSEIVNIIDKEIEKIIK